jgi:branched-chain amino acid transport system substrate-binding protein
MRHRRVLIAAGGTAILCLCAYGLVHRLTHRPLPSVQIAVAVPLSGDQQVHGQAIVDAVRLYFDEVNQQGGVNGHPVELIPLDDQGGPEVAVQQAKQATASPALAVLGHLYSDTTSAAAPVYKAAHLTAITASANDPRITDNNPYYFRAVMDNSSQGHTLAAYSAKVLNKKRASILYADDSYGKTLLAAFADEYADQGGMLEHQWAWNSKASDAEHAALMQQVSDDIANGEGGVLVLAVTPNTAARQALTLLRRAGVNPLVLGGTWLGTDFPRQFKDEPEEKREPGFFTNNTYIATPVIQDIAPERTLDFDERFSRVYGVQADEFATQYYDAAVLAVEALRRGGVSFDPGKRDQDRERVRDWLAGQTDLSMATAGLNGPLYFDETQSLPRPPRMGRCVEGRFISAPVQLEAVPNPALIDLDSELAAGHLIRIRQTFYWLQRVVYTGIDVNQISRIDPSKGTFSADFYLWFRYAGDDGVRDVDFNSATDKSPYDPKSPLLEQKISGLNYSLYRVHGDFRATYDFHDYPFDSQELAIRLTNPRMTREQVIYAVDTFGLRLPRADGGVSQLRPLSNWDFTQVRHKSDALTSYSTRGQPGAFHTNYETQFSGFNTVVSVRRKALVYLFKNLLPLLLLVLVVYVTLYFPISLLKERLTIAISAILASAVLLTAINSQLTDVGYTTAIEYGFYGFFGLCLYCVIAGLLTDRLHSRNNKLLADRFDIAVRVTYPIITVIVFAAYYFRYF